MRRTTHALHNDEQGHVPPFLASLIAGAGLVAIGIGAVLAFLLLLGQGFFVALLAPIAAMAAASFASRWIAERIGGYTGDTLGAVQQCAEIAFLVVAALFISR